MNKFKIEVYYFFASSKDCLNVQVIEVNSLSRVDSAVEEFVNSFKDFNLVVEFYKVYVLIGCKCYNERK